MEPVIVETLATGGPTAILALIIFLMYRKDRKRSEDQLRSDRVFMEDRLTKMLVQDQVSREDNTKALAELSVTLRDISRNSRK